MKNSFPAAITELRKSKGLTQKAAAKALGISQSLLSHYENGVRECTLDFVIRIADFYNVTCDRILGRSVPVHQEEEKPQHEHTQNIYDSLDIMFDLLERCHNQSVTEETAEFIYLAIYRIFRLVYFSGENSGDGIFKLPKRTYRALADAEMQISEADIRCALSGLEDGKLAPISDRKVMNFTAKELSSLYGDKFERLLQLLSKAEEKIM